MDKGLNYLLHASCHEYGLDESVLSFFRLIGWLAGKHGRACIRNATAICTLIIGELKKWGGSC
jgi:hypothetical protein